LLLLKYYSRVNALLTHIRKTACEGPPMLLVHPYVCITVFWQSCISTKKQILAWQQSKIWNFWSTTRPDGWYG